MPSKILMIDDHPLIIEGYRSILIQTIKEDLIISTSYSLEEAHKIIFNQSDKSFDLISIDVSMPPYQEKKLKDGIDLAILIRDKFPTIKLLMITMHPDPLILFRIYKAINPEGLLVKSDIDHEEFKLAFENVTIGNRYFSKTSTKAIQKVEMQNFCKDEINRQILFLISQRFTNKEIASELRISESTVEKRKALIKDYLNIHNGKDNQIIKVSKELGLL